MNSKISEVWELPEKIPLELDPNLPQGEEIWISPSSWVKVLIKAEDGVQESSPFEITVLHLAKKHGLRMFRVLADGKPILPSEIPKNLSGFKEVVIEQVFRRRN
jgi:hypothetical protein